MIFFFYEAESAAPTAILVHRCDHAVSAVMYRCDRVVSVVMYGCDRVVSVVMCRCDCVVFVVMYRCDCEVSAVRYAQVCYRLTCLPLCSVQMRTSVLLCHTPHYFLDTKSFSEVGTQLAPS